MTAPITSDDMPRTVDEVRVFLGKGANGETWVEVKVVYDDGSDLTESRLVPDAEIMPMGHTLKAALKVDA